jgi:hypothetical protein
VVAGVLACRRDRAPDKPRAPRDQNLHVRNVAGAESLS